jgi:hypothetical protein
MCAGQLEKVRLESADVLLYLVRIADQLNVDLVGPRWINWLSMRINIRSNWRRGMRRSIRRCKRR